MNRAGFFKAIAGGIAAVAGFKPVAKAKSLFNFKVNVIPGAIHNPDDLQLGARLLHAYKFENVGKDGERMRGYFRNLHAKNAGFDPDKINQNYKDENEL